MHSMMVNYGWEKVSIYYDITTLHCGRLHFLCISFLSFGCPRPPTSCFEARFPYPVSSSCLFLSFISAGSNTPFWHSHTLPHTFWPPVFMLVSPHFRLPRLLEVAFLLASMVVMLPLIIPQNEVVSFAWSEYSRFHYYHISRSFIFRFQSMSPVVVSVCAIDLAIVYVAPTCLY